MTEKSCIGVGCFMVPEVITIPLMATVREAIEVMRDQNVSSLVVERRDEFDEYGLLVVTDIAEHVIAKERSPDRVNVYEIMSKPVLTVPAEMATKYAVRLMVRFGVSRALVVDDRRSPVGIVTLRDLVLKKAETT